MQDVSAQPEPERLADLVNERPSLVHLGRFLTTDFLLEIGGTPYYVAVESGQVVRVERGPFLLRPWSFAIRIWGPAWERFCQPQPPPGYHDLFALTKRGEARVEGDLHVVMAHLRYIKDLLALLRQPVTSDPGE